MAGAGLPEAAQPGGAGAGWEGGCYLSPGDGRRGTPDSGGRVADREMSGIQLQREVCGGFGGVGFFF